MKVVVLGASGLVGSHLLDLLSKDKRIEKIYCLVRRSAQIEHGKVQEIVVDFDKLDALPKLDVQALFVAFGTTLSKAGSKENQFKIDVEIPSKVMQWARQLGIQKCALVSALGVNKRSPFFYSRMKAELDERARICGFDHLIIVKPSVLAGERKEKRTGEKIGIVLGDLIGKTGLFNAYKPIHARKVAASMIGQLLSDQQGYEEIPSAKIPVLSDRYFESQKK
jgi:uncharacterized protein YbjT (DUF2867 family)